MTKPITVINQEIDKSALETVTMYTNVTVTKE